MNAWSSECTSITRFVMLRYTHGQLLLLSFINIQSFVSIYLFCLFSFFRCFIIYLFILCFVLRFLFFLPSTFYFFIVISLFSFQLIPSIHYLHFILCFSSSSLPFLTVFCRLYFPIFDLSKPTRYFT